MRNIVAKDESFDSHMEDEEEPARHQQVGSDIIQRRHKPKEGASIFEDPRNLIGE